MYRFNRILEAFNETPRATAGDRFCFSVAVGLNANSTVQAVRWKLVDYRKMITCKMFLILKNVLQATVDCNYSSVIYVSP